MSELLIRIEKLRHSYGDQPVLKGISLSLRRGQIACILGPSGCGKTTLIRCIAGFEKVESGKIFLSDMCVSSRERLLPPEDRKIGIVFQDYALFSHLTVKQNIEFGLSHWTKPEKNERVAELLALTHLADVVDHYPHALSGGQQQRVALARALAPKPELLLLDEPFANLDVELREEMKKEVRKILKNQGATAIIVTHDQHEAFDVGDEIGVMSKGELIQWDTAYELYHRPKNHFVSSFVGLASFIPGKVVQSNPGQVETELGLLEGDLPRDCQQSGMDVEILIRPEDVVHHDEGAMEAEVIERAFRGIYNLFRVRLKSGRHIYCLAPSHHNHPVGSKIGIRFEIDHIVAFQKR